MALVNLCRLCLKLCNDSKSLYMETGETNEVYEIAVKYFHPMFLSVNQESKNVVMCLECWDHISDFYNYQQSVFQAQQNLISDQPVMEFQTNDCTASSEAESYDNPIMDENDDSVSLPDLELMEEFSFCDMTVKSVNDDPTNKTNFNAEYSEIIDLVDCELGSGIKDEEVEIPETSEEMLKNHSTSEEVVNGNLNSDCKEMINTMKRKRAQRKSSSELESIISSWKVKLDCVLCGVLLSSFSLLQQHFRQQHPTEQCYIVCCSRKFFTRAMVAEHARFHNDPNAFKCSKCDSKLASEASLYTHSRRCLTPMEFAKRSHAKTPLDEMDNFIALYKPNLECVVCHENSSRFTLLKTHFREKHPNDEFYVTCCQRKFNSRSAIKDHISLHIDPNAFSCKLCGRQQSSYKSLQMHMERMHSVPRKNTRLEDFKICAENTTLAENTDIQKQNSTIGGPAPPQFRIISAEQKPKPKKSREITPNVNKPYYNEFDEKLSTWKPVLVCVVCGESCRRYTKLQEHFRMKHPKYKCYFLCCQQQLHTQSEIEKHMLVHRDPNVYKCHICSDCFLNRETLRGHMKLRHPELQIEN